MGPLGRGLVVLFLATSVHISKCPWARYSTVVNCKSEYEYVCLVLVYDYLCKALNVQKSATYNAVQKSLVASALTKGHCD